MDTLNIVSRDPFHIRPSDDDEVSCIFCKLVCIVRTPNLSFAIDSRLEKATRVIFTATRQPISLSRLEAIFFQFSPIHFNYFKLFFLFSILFHYFQLFSKHFLFFFSVNFNFLANIFQLTSIFCKYFQLI